MLTAEAVVAALTARRELWVDATGSVGMRGDTLGLYERLEQVIRRLTVAESEGEWRMPAMLSLNVLERADYFASFPQWLTLVSHLGDDQTALESIATHDHPAVAAAAPRGAAAALTPAVCYHAYAALSGSVMARPMILTAQATCWRHEGDRHAPLERGWAFTMREIVYVGTEAGAAAFVSRMTERTGVLARTAGLDGVMADATDPFFAPTGRGKGVLQKLKGLKQELLLPVSDRRRVAASSFNRHERFFGEAFDIRCESGDPASTACVAFGLERWLLAYLCVHGIDRAGWSIMAHEGEPAA